MNLRGAFDALAARVGARSAFPVLDLRPLPAELLAPLEEPRTRYAWARLLNEGIRPARLRDPSGRSVADLSATIFQDGQAARTPQAETWWGGLARRYRSGRRTTPEGAAYWEARVFPYEPLLTGRGWTHVREELDGGSLLEADVFRASICRPWFEPQLLRSRGWRMDPESAGAGLVLSDGLRHGADGLPGGELPLLPTAIVFARRVSLSPREAAPAKDDEATWAGIWLCEVVARSPDPDPALPWPARRR